MDKQIHKSIVIADENDFSIIKHHIATIDYNYECHFRDGRIIDFYDDYLYSLIREFMNHTRIKSKINKD